MGTRLRLTVPKNAVARRLKAKTYRRKGSNSLKGRKR